MGKGTEKSPYTRKDVLRFIEEHGGPEGLDLSGKTFETGIDLRDIDLQLIILKKARFAVNFVRGTTTADIGAQLQKAKLMRAKLEGASLRFADLREVDLSYASFQGADLSDAQFEGARLYRAQFDNTTNLQGVSWRDYKIGEELDNEFNLAVDAYRRLKLWYTNAGMYDIAGEFFFREMTVARKAMKWWPNPLSRVWSKFLSLICGYGERPVRVIGWAVSVVLVSTLIYFVAGSVWAWGAFWSSLYFSAVSFTALGYGSWLWTTNDWIKGIGAFESFIGVFTIALFLITFIRKMTR